MAHDHGKVCPCVKYHSPKPEELHEHHIHPISAGGPDLEENLLFLCPTAHVNVHERQRSLLRTGEQAPYGNDIVRLVAQAGYVSILADAYSMN